MLHVLVRCTDKQRVQDKAAGAAAAAACLSLRQPKADSASCCLTALRTRPPSTTLHATLQTSQRVNSLARDAHRGAQSLAAAAQPARSMLPVLRITCVCYRVHANCVNSSFPSLRVSRTGPPCAAMAARRTLHQAALSRFVHVLFTLFCGRGALVLRRADTCALPACCGGGGGGGASAAFLGCIIARLLKARSSYLYFGPAAPPGVAG